MGGGKGGSDFDPKGKSDAEVMRFCQSFITELSKHIGQFTDVPAGDIGVGGREIGFMYGQYKRLRNEFTGVLTGKGLSYGGSLARTEATGYGLCYYMKRNARLRRVPRLRARRSPSPARATWQSTPARRRPSWAPRSLPCRIPMASSYDPNGINLDVVKDIKEVKRGRIKEYADRVPGSTVHRGPAPVERQVRRRAALRNPE